MGNYTVKYDNQSCVLNITKEARQVFSADMRSFLNTGYGNEKSNAHILVRNGQAVKYAQIKRASYHGYDCPKFEGSPTQLKIKMVL
jgi:hypothetical protein